MPLSLSAAAIAVTEPDPFDCLPPPEKVATTPFRLRTTSRRECYPLPEHVGESGGAAGTGRPPETCSFFEPARGHLAVGRSHTNEEAYDGHRDRCDDFGDRGRSGVAASG